MKVFLQSFESYIPNTATLIERNDLIHCFANFMESNTIISLELFQSHGVEPLLYETLYNAFQQHTYLYKQIISLFGDWRDIKYNSFFYIGNNKKHVLLDWVFGFVDVHKLLRLNYHFDLPIDFVDSEFFLQNSYKVFNKFSLTHIFHTNN